MLIIASRHRFGVKKRRRRRKRRQRRRRRRQRRRSSSSNPKVDEKNKIKKKMEQKLKFKKGSLGEDKRT